MRKVKELRGAVYNHHNMAHPSVTPGTSPGTIRLFRFAGIDVFLHWSWGLVAILELQTRKDHYQSPLWNLAEYLTLFLIVLLHEFGHSLACRSVGGRADRILLWPLGGVAYVDPPRRPGAMLWSIAAGPLVNVLLVPVTLGMYFFADRLLPGASRDLLEYLYMIAFINIGLLVFNMLPIYPLDGGQVLQSILWFFVGQARSLAIAATIGFIGAAAGCGLALYIGDWWLVIIAIFAASRCREGMRQSKNLSALLSQPRYGGMKCPSCGEAPVIGAVIARCACGQRFDPFSTGGACPSCRSTSGVVPCAMCNRTSELGAWRTPML
ncbi:MAG: site-2 protease family protein [Planctomycetota bacterium]